MLAQAARDSLYPRYIAQIDCNAASAIERSPVEFDPAWLAALRQSAVRHDDVCCCAGFGQFLPLDSVAASDCQQPPCPRVVGHVRETCVAAASREMLLLQILRLTIDRRRLAHQIANEISRPAPEQYRNAVLSNQCDMLPIPGNKQ